MKNSRKAIQEPNSFQCPNIIIDEYLKELSGSELKCFLFIIRKIGYLNYPTPIRIIDFCEATGLSNRAVIDATDSLFRKGFVCKSTGFMGVRVFSFDFDKLKGDSK